ncbi:MAG: glycosyltransferase family 1 protein, partial [bacterium]|nr:glycosyltransferase family 1 protein [bacterium]
QFRRLADELHNHLAGIQLYRTAEGHDYISRRQPGRLREWLPALTVTEELIETEIPPRGELDPTVIVGVRYGPLMQRVYEDTHHLFLTHSHPLYILEPDPVRFAAWLACAPLGPFLDDPRIYYFVGTNAVAELSELLCNDPGLQLPALTINRSRSAEGASMTEQARAAVEEVSQHRAAELDRCAAALEERYRGCDAAYWAERFQNLGPVLGITSRYTTVLQYSNRDAMEALGEMGFDAQVMIEPDDHHQYSPLGLCRKILELDPTMVLSLDHLRYEFSHFPDNLPMLTWIQDPLAKLLCREAGESIGPMDFVCGYFQERAISEYAYPEDAFVYTCIPASTRVFHDGPVAPTLDAQYGCDVCFVSNASEPLQRFYGSALEEYPDGCQPLLAHIYRDAREFLAGEAQTFTCVAAGQLVEQAIVALGATLTVPEKQHLINHFAYRLLDWGRRQQTLEWVADWSRRTGRSFKIYGRGWEDHPTLGGFAAGVLEHGEPLRAAYKYARLALQLIPGGFEHQRTYELLLSGTLPLTRYCPEDFAGLSIADYAARRDGGESFEGAGAAFPALERIVFSSPDEFEQLAGRFLSDSALRDRVRGDFREVVLARYTYSEVMREVMSGFRARLACEEAKHARSVEAAAAVGAVS